MLTLYYQLMVRGTFIAVVDFGSQYTHLITRNLRELGVESRLIKPTAALNILKGAAGIILSGSPVSVIKNPIPFNTALLKTKRPILGICYGLQLVTHLHGGQVSPSHTREYGRARLTISRPHPLLAGFSKTSTVWMSHGDSVTKLAPGFTTIASTASLKFAAVAHRTKPIFGVQFHPEVHHTTFGRELYRNFAFTICGLVPTTTQGVLERITSQVKTQVGNKKVFLFVSGGVDSTVVFALLNRILGSHNVYGLHIDTGLMRHQESTQVKRSLERAGFKNLQVVNAGPLFLKQLRGVAAPEKKRQIIGETFLQVKAGVEKKLKLNTRHWLLGQGTIYPDTIESGGTKHANKIKTHHNRIGILANFARQGLLVEPLKELYKDEVRQLGLTLGLPKELVWAHPFPGPGLGVRTLCLSPKTAAQLNTASNPSIKVQKFSTRTLPLLSVGVQGDERSYRNPLAINAPYKQVARLHRLATGLVNRHPHINRVILQLWGNPLINGAAQVAYLTPPRVALARAADHIVTDELRRGRVYSRLWQCPVVLAPFGERGHESVIIRPFESREAMTGRAHLLPSKVVKRIIQRLRGLNAFDHIFYDLTDKPPGTVEWE